MALQDVVFRWRAGLPPCLDIREFRMSAAERVFLHGPSGSGKSSLLSLIGGVTQPERGQVGVLGTDLARLSGAERDRFRADHLGFVFQLFNLIPYLSALDNILLPCRFSPARRAAVAAAGRALPDEARRLAQRLDLDPALLARPAVRAVRGPAAARRGGARADRPAADRRSPTSRPRPWTPIGSARSSTSCSRSAPRPARPSCSSATTSGSRTDSTARSPWRTSTARPRIPRHDPDRPPHLAQRGQPPPLGRAHRRVRGALGRTAARRGAPAHQRPGQLRRHHLRH